MATACYVGCNLWCFRYQRTIERFSTQWTQYREISNTLFKNVLIIPANYAFAIWGLIYLGLFAFGIYQALPNQRDEPDLRKTGYLLMIACVAQSIWVYLFLSRLFALSVIAMF